MVPRTLQLLIIIIFATLLLLFKSMVCIAPSTEWYLYKHRYNHICAHIRRSLQYNISSDHPWTIMQGTYEMKAPMKVANECALFLLSKIGTDSMCKTTCSFRSKILKDRPQWPDCMSHKYTQFQYNCCNDVLLQINVCASLFLSIFINQNNISKHFQGFKYLRKSSSYTLNEIHIT